MYSLFSLPQLFSFYLIAKFTFFFLQNIQIAFQDTCFSHDTPPWLTWYSTQEVVRERVTTTVQKNLYNDFFWGFHFTRCCWCNVSANVRQSFLRLGSMGMLPTSHQRILHERSQIQKIVQNNLKGFNKIETKNALKPGLRIWIVENFEPSISSIGEIFWNVFCDFFLSFSAKKSFLR